MHLLPTALLGHCAAALWKQIMLDQDLTHCRCANQDSRPLVLRSAVDSILQGNSMIELFSCTSPGLAAAPSSLCAEAQRRAMNNHKQPLLCAVLC